MYICAKNDKLKKKRWHIKIVYYNEKDKKLELAKRSSLGHNLRLSHKNSGESVSVGVEFRNNVPTGPIRI